MKKVLVFALVLSLVLGSFSFAFAAEFDDTADTDCEAAVNVLTDLGVVAGYPDGTYQPEGIVTRAEMAKLIIVALGMEDYVKGAYAAYSDVPGSHWATSYIAYADSLGIIKGYPDGQFKPDNTVTYQEAATMIVRALGYQDQYLTGVWPASHVSMAMNLGVLDGIIATAEGANRGDIAIMLYQALACNIVLYDSSGNVVEDKDTMLNRLGATPVNPDADGTPLPVVITKAMADDAVIDLDDYVGAFAAVYVNADDEIIVLAEVVSTFLTGEYDASDEEFTLDDDTAYTMDKRAEGDWPNYNLKEYTAANGYVTTTSSAVGFYNGEQDKAKVGTVITAWDATSDDKDYFTIAAKVSGNYITDIYSVVQWEINAEVQWDADLAAELAEDDTISDWAFDMTDDDVIDTDAFILAGADSLDAIAEDNVVTIYADKDDATGTLITKVAVGTETVTGKITKVNSDGDEFTIDGTAYAESPEFAGDLKLGDEGTFFLNLDGDIAFFDADDYAGNYAVILDWATLDTAYGGSSVAQHYLLNKAGDDVVYDYKSADTAKAFRGNVDVANPATSGGQDIIGNLVEIETNNDGELTAIRDKVTEDAFGGKLSTSGVLDGKLVSEDVVVFDISAVDSDDWYVGTIADVKVDEAFADDALFYGVNADGKVDVIVIELPSAADTVTDFGFFTSWESSYNTDDDAVFSGKVLVDGAAVDYITTDQTDADVKTKDTLFVLTYDGEAIESASAAAIGFSADINGDFDNFSGGVNAIVFSSDVPNIAVKTFAVGNMDHFYKVIAKDGDRIDVGIASPSAIDYQLIEGAVAYKVKLNAAGTAFSKLEVGSLSAVKKDCYAMLLQLDEESETWDTVIYVTKADAAELKW